MLVTMTDISEGWPWPLAFSAQQESQGAWQTQNQATHAPKVGVGVHL